jgi:TonB family protein
MSKRGVVFFITIGFFFLNSFIHASEDITIQVRFFQGTWEEGQNPLQKQVEVLSAASHPKVALLKEYIAGPESELKTAVVDFLLDAKELNTVTDLFSFEKTWDGREKLLSEPVMVRPASAFRLNFFPQLLSPTMMTLQTSLYFQEVDVSRFPGKDPDRELRNEMNRVLRRYEKLMNRILDLELKLEMDVPQVISIPFQDKAYFFLVSWKRKSHESEQEEPPESKKSVKSYITEALEPTHQVPPVYPFELRRQGVEGEVKLRVLVDDKGNVSYVEVVKSLHPYLDYTAVQALTQWRFKPGLRRGKPVPAVFVLTFNFDPETWRQYEETAENQKIPSGHDEASAERLRNVLERCSEYCRMLAGAALDFICEEKIKEVHYHYDARQIVEQKVTVAMKTVAKKQTPYGPAEIVVGVGSRRLWRPKQTVRNSYLCDYQLVKMGSQIEERRIILKENGRKPRDSKNLLKEKRLSVFRPILTAASLLERDRHFLFTYKILKQEKVEGRKAYLIEAVPRFGDAGGVEHALIWVDIKTYQIIKTEIEGIPLDGYEDVLKEAIVLNVKPEFKTTHLFQIEKNGVLFPAKSKVRVAYPRPPRWILPVQKLSLDMNYRKFKFFTVETDHKIIKKISTSSLFQRLKCRPKFSDSISSFPG